jgi:arylsulfatase A-like enzyme
MSHPPRNLLVILTDQLRRQALGCYGDPDVQTPHIDALAARGVRFTAASSTYPVCVPFRFSMMTGQQAHTRMVPAIEWSMSPAERTLADELNASGRETIWVGKWHLHGGQLHMPGYGAEREGLRPVPRSHQGRWKHWRAPALAS